MTAPVPLACNLDALDRDEQTRRAALAARVASRFREVRETAAGYRARLDAEPEIARDALEWLLLERRCCPFLRLALELEPSEGALWLALEGGPGVKEFLAAAGLKTTAVRAATP